MKQQIDSHHDQIQQGVAIETTVHRIEHTTMVEIETTPVMAMIAIMATKTILHDHQDLGQQIQCAIVVVVVVVVVVVEMEMMKVMTVTNGIYRSPIYKVPSKVTVRLNFGPLIPPTAVTEVVWKATVEAVFGVLPRVEEAVAMAT